jgi:hypothetical protein
MDGQNLNSGLNGIHVASIFIEFEHFYPHFIEFKESREPPEC